MGIMDGFNAWKKERKRKEEKPTFQERNIQDGYGAIYSPAAASRIKDSSTRSSKWETELLKDLPSKAYGRSYNDRLENALNEIGIQGEDAQSRFRQYMDGQEQGIASKQDKEDDIFNFLEDESNARAQRYAKGIEKRNAQAEAEPELESTTKSTKKDDDGERDGFFGFLDSTLGRASKAAQERILGKKFVENQADMYEENAKSTDNEEVKKMQNTINREAEGGLEKTFDFIGAATGEVAPYALGYGAAAKIPQINAIRNPVARDFVRGAVGSAGGESVIQGVQTAAGEEKTGKDYAKEIGMAAAFGGTLDAGIGIVGRKIADKLARGKAPEAIAAEEGVSIQDVESIAQQTMDDFQPDQLPKWDQQFDPLGFIEKSDQRALNGVDIPQVDIPGPLQPDFNRQKLDDMGMEWLNFGNSSKYEPQARPGEMINPLDDILKNQPIGHVSSRWNQVANANPREVFKDQIDGIVGQQNQLYGSMSERQNQYVDENLQRIMSGEQLAPGEAGRQSLEAKWEEDKYLALYNDPEYLQAQQREMSVSEAELEFSQSVKAAKDEKKQILDRFGKIIIPDGNWADWGQRIPPAFRAKRGSTQGDDIYKVADEMNMTPDELVDYLGNINNASKQTKKALYEARGVGDMYHLSRSGYNMNGKTDQLEKMIKQRWMEEQGAAMNQSGLQLPEGVDEDGLRQMLLEEYQGQPQAQAEQELMDALSQDYDSLLNAPKEEIYQALRQEGDPGDLEDLLYMLGPDMQDMATPQASEMWSMLNSDPRIREAAQNLAPSKQAAAQPVDMPPEATDPLQELLGSQETLGQGLEPGAVDDPFSAILGDAQSVTPDVPKEGPTLLRSNLQMFDDTNLKTSDSLVSKSDPKESTKAIDQVRNVFKRSFDKGYEKLINKRHSLHVADRVRTEDALDNAIKSGKTEDIVKLQKRLTDIKKNGSQIEKASNNEETASVMTNNLLNRHFEGANKILKGSGVSTKDAMHYQLAKNLDYILNNVDPKYQLPDGWNVGRLNQIINKAEIGDKKDVYAGFTDSMKGLMDDVRQLMLDYDLKPSEEVDALAQNPFYIPMYRDRGWMEDNVARGNVNSRKSSTSNAMLDLYGLQGGDLKNYLKNPLESIAELTHMVVRKGLQNDTALELSKLADIETDLAKSIGNKAAGENILVRYAGKDETPDIVGTRNGEQFGLKLQQDLKDVLDEGRDVRLPSNFMSALSRGYAGLKTRTLAHQIVATPRDMLQGYFNSRINNPVQYMAELARVVKDGNMDAKRLGAHFEKGFNSHTGGVEAHGQMVDQFVKENSGKFQKFDISKKDSWVQLGKKLDKWNPATAIGKLSDDSMRSVEVRAVEREYQPQIDALQQEITQMESSPDFDPASMGLDTKKQELKDLQRQMRREATYEGRDMMNYSRTGRAGAVQNIIKPYLVFANTTTQSKDRFFRQFKKNPVGTMGKVGVPIAGMYAIQQAAYEGASDEQKKTLDLAPDYVKDYFYMFPNGNDKWFLVPKPHETVPLTKAIESAGEQYFGNRENPVGDPMNEVYRQLVQEYVPLQMGNVLKGFMPDRYDKINPQEDSTIPGTALGPFLDVAANKKLSFNNKPISSDNPYPVKGMDGYNPDEGSMIIPEGLTQDQVSAPWTPEYAKQLGGDTVNADYIDYILKDLLGDYSTPVRNAAEGATQGDPLSSLLNDLTIRKVNRDAYTDKEKEKYLKK